MSVIDNGQETLISGALVGLCIFVIQSVDCVGFLQDRTDLVVLEMQSKVKTDWKLVVRTYTKCWNHICGTREFLDQVEGMVGLHFSFGGFPQEKYFLGSKCEVQFALIEFAGSAVLYSDTL